MSPNEGDRTMIPMLRAKYRRVNHSVRISSPRQLDLIEDEIYNTYCVKQCSACARSLTKVAEGQSDMARSNSHLHVGGLCKPCLHTEIMTEYSSSPARLPALHPRSQVSRIREILESFRNRRFS